MISIRGASGYGDAYYIYPVIKDIRKNTNEEILIYTDFQDVYKGIDNLSFTKYKRSEKVKYDLHYISRRENNKTNMFEDTCLLYGKQVDYDFGFKKTSKNTKNVLIIDPYEPSWCRDINSFVPDINLFNKIKEYLFFLGYNIISPVLPMNRDQWEDTIDNVDLVICQSCSAFVIAEAFCCPCMVIFNHLSKTTDNFFVKCITPHKVIMRKETIYAYDNYEISKIFSAIEEQLLWRDLYE